MTPQNMDTPSLYVYLDMARITIKNNEDPKVLRNAWATADQILDELNNRKHETVEVV